MHSLKILFVALTGSLLIAVPAAVAKPAKPVLLYARYFNAEGEKRYVPDKDYSLVLDRLTETFELRVNRDEPTAALLTDVDVILISNPSQNAVDDNAAPPGFQSEMIARLAAFVERGGGIIVMGNQENHNLEIKTTNQLLSRFGLSFEETYTDIKALTIPTEAPMIGGLRWGYYSGNAIAMSATENDHRSILQVRNDPALPMLKGDRNPPSLLMAARRLGKGIAIAVTDAGWITNTVLDGPGIANIKIPDHDNFEIFRRLALLAARPELPARTSDQVVFAGAPERLLEQSAGEGPAWDDELGLLTSHGGDIHQFRDGKSSVFRKDARTNGLLFDSDGNLLCCEPGRKRVTRLKRDESLAVLTESFHGNPYNTPNDLTVDTKGRIYFSDPRYGPRNDMAIRDRNGIPVEGVYRIDIDGSVERIITHEVDRPNGVLVSRNQKWLLVSDNNNNTVAGARRLYRFKFDVNTGTIDPNSRTVLFDWGSGRGPDGLAEAASGVIYVAAGRTRAALPSESCSVFPGGIYALSIDGALLGFSAIPNDEVTNCSVGGIRRNTLFVTAGGELWSIPLPAQ